MSIQWWSVGAVVNILLHFSFPLTHLLFLPRIVPLNVVHIVVVFFIIDVIWVIAPYFHKRTA